MAAAEVTDMAAVPAHPTFGEPALEALAAAYAAAQGMGDGMVERFACRETCSPTRAPGAAAVIRLTGSDAALLAPVCHPCAGQSDAGPRETPPGATRRDFLADARDVSANLHERGRA